MRHNLRLEGLAFRLRPITDADAALVIQLRGDTERTRYLHPASLDLQKQLAWFANYYERPNDYYFVVERRDSDAAEGVVSLYDVNPQDRTGEWGRWILKPGSLAAESAWLIYRCAFEQVGLKQVFCRTNAANLPVVSFHDFCGITARQLLPDHYNFNGTLVDAVEHEVTTQTWTETSSRLKKLAEMTARKVLRGRAT